MKILWFTNTSSLYAEKNNRKTSLGGWIPSLERLFRANNIDLRIAFHSNVNSLTQDVYNSNIYYLIPGFGENTKLSRLKQRWLNKKIDRDKVLAQYKEIIDDFEPDLVHFWGSEQMFGLVIPYLKVPHILHIQGNVTACYQKYYAGITKLELKKALTFKKWLKREPYFFSEKDFLRLIEIEKEIYKNCKNFFGRTNWDQRIVNVLSPDSRYFHCNEIMRDDFYNHNWVSSFDGKKLRIISVIRDSIFKGIESIYDSAKILSDHNLNFCWDIIGVDKNSQAIDIIKRNRTYSLEALPINLHGFVDAEKLIEYYNVADVFVHTSHMDNSPNSVCEAMILGIPIVSTNVGGVPSLISDGQTGVLIQDGDNYALSGALLQIYGDYQSASKRAQKAKEVAHKRHNKQDIYNNVVDTYKMLIS